jgi:hypothetical protein
MNLKSKKKPEYNNKAKEKIFVYLLTSSKKKIRVGT